MSSVVCPHCGGTMRPYGDMGYTGVVRKCGLCNKALPTEAEPVSKVLPSPAPAPAQSALAAVVAAPTAPPATATPAAGLSTDEIVTAIRERLAAVEKEIVAQNALLAERDRLRRMLDGESEAPVNGAAVSLHN